MTEIVDHPILLLVLIVVSWPIYRAFADLLFGNRDEIEDAVHHWLVPDIVSLFRGQWFEAQWAEFKLGVFGVACFVTVAAEYTAIARLIARWN